MDIKAPTLGHDDFGRRYWRSAPPAPVHLPALSPASIDLATFRMLADNLPTLCWIANGDGYIVWYNRRWHEYCGTTEQDMEGWGWQSVHDPTLLPAVMQRWTSSIAAGEPFEMTFPLKGADGMFRPFLTRIQPVRDASGKVARWFGVNTEIFDQVSAEEALRAERDRSRSVLEGMDEGFVLLARNFHVLDINAEGLRLETRPREEIVGRSHWEAWPNTEHSELGRLYQGAMVERVPVRLEHHYVWPDGREAWVEVRAYPVPDGLAIFYRDVTDRKHAAADLEAASTQNATLAAEQAAILGQLAEGVIVTDVEGRITFVNEAAERLHGVKLLDVAPDEYADSYHLLTEDGQPYPPRELPLARAVLDGETVVDARWLIRQPGDRQVVAIGNAKPLLDEAGRQTGAVLTLRDDTARATADAALRESETQLRALADNLPSGMAYQLAMRRDGSERRFVYVSQSHAGLTGVSAAAVLADASAPYNLILPEYRERLAAAEAEAIGGLKPFDMEVPFRRADTGEVRWSRILSAPRVLPDGSLLWDGLQLDDTDRKRAEDALRESRDRLASESHALEVLNRTGTQVAAELGLDTLVQRVVDAGVELTGAQLGAFFYNVPDDRGGSYMLYALSGAPRSAFDGFGMPRATPVFAPTFRGEGVVRSGDILKDERYGRNAPHLGMPTGHPPVRSFLSVPVISRSGDVIGGLFFGHARPDIFSERSERVMTGLAAQAAIGIDNARLFEAVQKANAELEQRVEERTAELEKAHEALRQSQKMEAVGQLTGGIAHDFNNMLAVVVGSLDLLGRRLGTADARALRYVDAAKDGARRAALLTQRLLAFSRQQPLRPEPIDANKLVAGMSDLLRHSLGADVRLETVLAGGPWRIHADPNQLENVILNLAVNARDAMPEGGRLTIETHNTHLDARYVSDKIGVPAGQYVLIAVTDTGSGMTPEVIARAFDPFFTTKGVGKGTGLGLSQVYGFVKQSGGHVKIYSEPGQGTTVKIYLPRLLGAVGDVIRDDAAPEMPLGEQQEVVLVVEDEPAVRQFSVDALGELGYRVLEADGASAALRLLDAHSEIALMFTDVVMPDVNGRKLADEAHRRRPGLKVLFTTGYTRNAVVHNGVLDPGVELIGKPFTIEELAAKVREVLDAPVTETGG